MKEKVLLAILDGYGIGNDEEGNAIIHTKTPNIDKFFNSYSHAKLKCSGEDVGLPKGTMGNSEVGHLNIGAGRIVPQDLMRINHSIKDRSFFDLPEFSYLLNNCYEHNKKMHIMGLLSKGDVHSSFDHLLAIIDLLESSDLDTYYLHLFSDGRDTDPNSGKEFAEEIEKYLISKKGKIATISGRYYAMDRDQRWDRIKKVYDLLVRGVGNFANSTTDLFSQSYKSGVTDEFILPTAIKDVDGRILEGDSVLFFNFRSDRARELSIVLNDTSFKEFDVEKLFLKYVTMTRYQEDFSFPVIFKKVTYQNILGQVVSDAGLQQLRIAETEKYAHVTFFFNGGNDQVFQGEDRILVNSPKVATYDLKPEMSIYEVTEKLVEALNNGKYHMIILNFANCDMVGHTGVYDAVSKAITAVDQCLGKVIDAASKNGYTSLITADHGNAEKMYENGRTFTAHTTNQVPIVLATDHPWKIHDGKLGDIAPTILDIMGILKPAEMTGKSLIERNFNHDK